MVFIIAAAAAVFLLAAGAVLLYGTAAIVAGGFLRFAIGALLMGMSLSVVMSVTANLLLVTMTSYNLEPSPPVIFARSFLAAMGQPTLTGVIGLSLVALIALTASKVRMMVEEMDVLIRAHASFATRTDRASSS
ncbi:hypothetical protein NESM_000102600 [Novymonas esmeraldas]|uniref:Uncharacterized protein n=1 Tax=Novymonas esmeraldas TaxID=1808958 RepID=A0AAW0F5P5_9TRYP